MTRNKIKIALTGGIGSGKSTVAQLIAARGFKVFSCDRIYGELLSDGNMLRLLSDEFGEKIIFDGKIDRTLLAEIAFSDTKKIARLNKITHPLIIGSALSKMDTEDISFCEVPLLFEEGYEKLFDNIIVVLREKAERIAAVTGRNNLTAEQVVKRMEYQINYDNTDFAKYYVIHNDSNFQALKNRTDGVLNDIINLYHKI